MGFFDIFKSQKNTDIEYIKRILKSSGYFQGRQFNPEHEFRIDKGFVSMKPRGVAKPEAQKALDSLQEGSPLNVSANEGPGGTPFLFIRTKGGVLLGDIQWAESHEDLQIIYDMAKAGVKIDCTLSAKGRFWASSLHKKIWWCEVSLPVYEVWSVTGVQVWTMMRAKYYHCTPTCNKNAELQMTEEEAAYRGKVKCPKCYHLKAAEKSG